MAELSKYVLLSAGLALFILATSVEAGIEDLVITEIQAVNTSTITDEDGDHSDWLEIYNAGTSSVNLRDCFLTDDPEELNKWKFPSKTLRSNDFLVVFCSDKDRRVSSRELHTNFKLSSGGEFLALVAPDGQSLLSAYEPGFPPLLEDFSYGARMNADFFNFVDEGTPTLVRVPRSVDSGVASRLDWTDIDFDDSGWRPGTPGVGYDNGSDYDGVIGTEIGSLMNGVNTSAWIRIPFTVNDPDSLETLVLRVKYDDGFIAYLNGVKVADANSPTSPAAWNAAASDDHPDAEALVFQEWTISNGGRLREGTNVLAIHGLNRNVTSSDFLIFPELDAGGAGVLDPTTREFFNRATPGSGNVEGFPGVSPKPVLEPPDSVFTDQVIVSMSVDSPDARIRYTTDLSMPTESSPLYAGPILLTTTTFVRASSFTPGLSPSPVVSGSYVTVSSSLRSRTSSVPIVVIDTMGRSVPGTGSASFGPAFMLLFDRGEDGRTRLSSAPDIAHRIGIKERGSSSGGRPKASYRFEFWDDHDEDFDLKPLGLPKESDWILYGAYNFDRTHMRNPFIYELSRQTGNYAARTRFVEVYLNTNGGALSTSDYWGVYSLMENVKRGDKRVDVERLDPSITTAPDISGGYIFKKDRSDPGGSGGFSAGGVSGIQFVYPDVNATNPEQRSWIQSHLSTVFSTSSFMNYIDPLAAVDHHILNAMPKNVDAFRLSGYFHKARNGPVVFGPIWDFDRSMDSTDGRDNAWNTWRGSGDSSGYFALDDRTPYWSRWLQDRDFRQLWIDRWFELREGPMSTANILNIIDTMKDELEEAAARDQSKWRQTNNWTSDVSLLRNWLRNRVGWIDDQWLDPLGFSRAGGPISPGTELRISGSSGTIYYTLDGTDPRRAGGSVAAAATQYDGPISLVDNARVVARARASSSSWSAPIVDTFVVTTPPLVITELMYHPYDPEEDSPFDSDDFEFVEIMNVGTRTLEMEGTRLAGGIDFTFDSSFLSGGASALRPGERVIVVSDMIAFPERYDTAGIVIAGEYVGRLNNAGDVVRLDGPLLEPIHDFEYGEDWYPATDGRGPSLSIVDPFRSLDNWSDSGSWAPSTVEGGTPGQGDPGLEGSGGLQTPGDANQDGTLEIGDAVALLDHLYGGGRELPCEGATIAVGANRSLLDLDGNTSVDVTDVLVLLNFLFSDGPEPALGSFCVRIEGCPDTCGF